MTNADKIKSLTPIELAMNIEQLVTCGRCFLYGYCEHAHRAGSTDSCKTTIHRWLTSTYEENKNE